MKAGSFQKMFQIYKTYIHRKLQFRQPFKNWSLWAEKRSYILLDLVM